MIEIDGSYGEGGGQILRMSVALSALLGKAVRVTNIRAGRPNPGLRRQHVTAIKAVEKICRGRAEGLKEGSLSIEFYPGKISGGEHAFDIGTAGSITLVFQACLLPSLFAERETKILLTGGTDVKWAPPWDYFRHVFLPLLQKVGVDIRAKLYRRGYYPKGGGKAEVTIKPCRELHPMYFNENAEKEVRVKGTVNISSLPMKIAERIGNAAEKEFSKKGMIADIKVKENDSLSPGVGITLWTAGGRSVTGTDRLGEKGKPAEQVGKESAQHLIKEIEAGADLDEKAVDQLFPYMAMAHAPSYFTCRVLSGHAETEIWLLEKFLDVKFKKRLNDGIVEIAVIPRD